MAELLAKDIMIKKVITVSKDATLVELANLLMKNKISGVPVINEEKELVGKTMARAGDSIGLAAGGL